MNQKTAKIIHKFVKLQYGSEYNYKQVKKEYLQMTRQERTKEMKRIKEILSY